jgi:hypothetical protein
LTLQRYQTGNNADGVCPVSRREPLHLHFIRVKLEIIDDPLQGFPDNCLRLPHRGSAKSAAVVRRVKE